MSARTPTATGRRTAFVELTEDLDPQRWQHRHAAGEVPDAAPYGLDRLSQHGFHVRFRAPTRSALLRRADRRLRPAAGGLQLLPAAVAAASVARRDADVTMCWDELVGLPALARAAVVHQPVVTGVVWLTDDQDVPRQLRRAAQLLLPRADAVWALSTAMLEPLARQWAVPRHLLHYVPFGVDVDFFRPAGPVRPGLVVSAGNDRHRDHDVLVRAVGRLRARGLAARLELATRLPVLVPAELGRAGPLPSEAAVRDLYAQAAVVAVATRPNLHVSGLTVLLEAMAVGRPVVAFAHPGTEEYVVHGSTGLLVPPGDEAAFTDALATLMHDPAAAAAMGAAGRRRVVERCSTQTQAGHLATVLRSVC